MENRRQDYFIIFFVGLFAYANSFYLSFCFDDFPAIVDNLAIQNIHNFNEIWNVLPSRALVVFSFAIDYFFWGLNAFGYHLVNFILHVFTSLFLYTFLQLILGSKKIVTLGVFEKDCLEKSNVSYERFFPLFTTLLFISHPVQTHAVTYISQRFTLFAALFYLLALVLYLKSSLHKKEKNEEQAKSNIYLLFAFISACCAMLSKPNAATLPLALLLVEYCFIQPSFQAVLSQWRRLLPFFLAIFIIPVSMLFSKTDYFGQLMGKKTFLLSNSDYFITQFNVIQTYLRLLFFPINQNSDYDYPVPSSIFELGVLVGLFLVLFLLYTAYRLFHKSPPISFGILFFFLALSIESSFMPLDAPAYEYRLYLPSVGFFIVFVSILFALFRQQKQALIVLSVMVFLFSVCTRERNTVWQNQLTMWSDVVNKSPKKVRGHFALGIAYLEGNQLDKALHEFKIANDLSPGDVQIVMSIGNVYLEKNMYEKAENYFRRALTINEMSDIVHYNLGVVFEKQQKDKEALKEYYRTIAINPRFGEAHRNLGVYYYNRNERKKAAGHLLKAVEVGYKVQPELMKAVMQ